MRVGGPTGSLSPYTQNEGNQESARKRAVLALLVLRSERSKLASEGVLGYNTTIRHLDGIADLGGYEHG